MLFTLANLSMMLTSFLSSFNVDFTAKSRFRAWAVHNVYLFPLPTMCLLGSIDMFCADVAITSYFLYGVNLTKFIILAVALMILMFLYLAFLALCSKGPPRSLSVNWSRLSVASNKE